MSLTCDDEVKARLALGCRQLTLEGMAQEFKALGYVLDFGAACDCQAQIMTGERAGETYPCRTLGMTEAGTKRSAYHFESRKDDNFKAMQALRLEVFAVVAGRMVEA